VRQQLEQGIGMASFCFLYLRILFAILDIAYLASRAFPVRNQTEPRGPLREELLAAALLIFFAESDLRSELYDRLPASDATLGVGGACLSGNLPQPLLRELHELTESDGEPVRLDWIEKRQEGPPPDDVRM